MSNVPRLYPQLEPTQYDITLDPDITSATFAGEVVITARLAAATDTITLHAADIDIKHATINQRSASYTYDEHQHVHLHAPQTLEPGTVTVAITYQGRINDTMHGLYRSSFQHEGVTKQLLATQFEPIHAREVFPCVDEPAAKAIFTLTVTLPQNFQAVSNTEPAQQTTDEQGTTTTFHPTPLMSPYLFALVAGELDYKESTTANDVTVRAYATPDKVDQTAFALETATRTLDFFQEYFAIPYPLETLDLVAVPDFAAGAMENWGCVTFREALFLVDKEHTALFNQQHTALVIAHELAHQWFGNLVTMEWWTDLWLNEGFASWIEYLAVDELFPHWHIWEQFITHDQQEALHSDSLASSHPVEVPIDDPQEIDEVFDAISYKKGASLIHMLHAYLGPERFRDGLRHYLDQYRYRNARTHDLWEALSDVCRTDIASFMAQWTENPYYPLLDVQQHSTGLTLEQTPFLLLDSKQPPEYTWPVPLNYQPGGSAEQLLTEAKTQLQSAPTDYKFNRHQTGFYRVAYPDDRLQQLFERWRDYPTLDVAGLIDDSFALSEAGQHPISQALERLLVFENATNYTLWSVITHNVLHAWCALGDAVLTPSYMRRLLDTQIARLGYESQDQDSPFDQLLRPKLLSLLARSAETETVNRLLEQWRDGKAIAPDLRRVHYFAAGRFGTDADYQQLWQLYHESSSAEEKTRLVSGLCAPSNPDHIQQSLDAISSDAVRLQEFRIWLAHLFHNHDAKQLTWEWLQDNWTWVDQHFRSSHAYSDIPKLAATCFFTDEAAQAVQMFFQDTMPRRSLEQAVERIRINARWRERDYDRLQTFAHKFQNNHDV